MSTRYETLAGLCKTATPETCMSFEGWLGGHRIPRVKINREQVSIFTAVFLSMDRKIPTGKYIAHICANLWCINPYHLRSSDKKDKNKRGLMGKHFSLEETMRKYYKAGKAEECWLWEGGISGNGYGVVSENRRALLAHRVQYTISIGPIPNDMLILHSCDNRACVNPNHLRVGTHMDNMDDRRDRKRTAVGNKTGNATLMTEEVQGILQSTDTHVALAKEYSVNRRTIERIRNGRTWSHVSLGGK